MLGDLVAEHLFHDQPAWAWVTLLAVMGVWFLLFGWLSRRFELEADLFSLDLLGEVRSLISALEKVGGRLRDVASWRHFSTAERVEFLERAQLDPNVGRRLRRDLRRFTWFGVGLFVITGVLQITRLLGTLPEDRVRAELRLGHYERAHELAAQARLDPPMAELVERAWETRADPSIRALAAHALAAVREGDFERAIQWVELARARGDEAMMRIGLLLEETPQPVRTAMIISLLEQRAAAAK
jgi:hypothetical protein